MTATRGSEDAADRKSLSKNLLQMKFMQKGVVVKLDAKEEMEKRIKRSKEHWVVGGLPDQPKQLPYQFDATIVTCEDLLPIGRMSFKNYNPVVEKTHKQVLRRAKKKCTTTDRDDDDDEAEDVSDDEMAERFETLVQTIDNKFTAKRKRNGDEDDRDESSDSDSDEEARDLKKRAKRGFLKPLD